MSKLTLAKKLVDQTGVSFSKATRFIDDLGASNARRVIDDTVEAGQDTVSKWWKPAAGAGAIIGGGALAWRQQDVAVARAVAEREQTRTEALRDIIESDIDPELKEELLNRLSEDAGGDPGDDPGAGNPFDNLPWMIGGVIVLLFVLNYATTAGATLGTAAGGR